MLGVGPIPYSVLWLREARLFPREWADPGAMDWRSPWVATDLAGAENDLRSAILPPRPVPADWDALAVSSSVPQPACSSRIDALEAVSEIPAPPARCLAMQDTPSPPWDSGTEELTERTLVPERDYFPEAMASLVPLPLAQDISVSAPPDALGGFAATAFYPSSMLPRQWVESPVPAPGAPAVIATNTLLGLPSSWTGADGPVAMDSSSPEPPAALLPSQRFVWKVKADEVEALPAPEARLSHPPTKKVPPIADVLVQRTLAQEAMDTLLRRLIGDPGLFIRTQANLRPQRLIALAL